MTKVGSLLYRSEVPITDKIIIRIPKVGDIIDKEDEYYADVSMLTATPTDYMVQLADINIYFDEINDYDMLFILFNALKESGCEMIFKDLNLGKFIVAYNKETEQPVLYDEEDDIVIDRVIHSRIADTLRKIHYLERNEKKPGNKEARDYLIERARKKQKRRRKKKQESDLGQLITAMVNTEQFKYDYASTRELTIYQFNESVRQIQHKVEYDNLMHGVYAGTVDPKGLSQDSMNWLIH